MDFWEIFTLVTGVIYIVLEIRQSDWMWPLGILTAATAVYVFLSSRLWASMGLNVYYAVISVIGIFAWARDRRKLREQNAPEDALHLTQMSPKAASISGIVTILGCAGLFLLLRFLEDASPLLDALSMGLSALATFWLAKSYPQHWLLWVLADSLSAVLCISQGLYWMGALYGAYCASAVYGYIYWKKKGIYV